MEDANGAAHNSSLAVASNTKEKEKQEPCNGHGGGGGGRRLRFPPGYRFMPTDEELIVHYLKPRVREQPLPPNIIIYFNVYRYDPDRLIKETHGRDGGATEWFFFTPRKRKYPKGRRPCRAAGNGFWKATGADKPIDSCGVRVGCRKALVYYANGKKSDVATKTNWIMHEFRVAESKTTTSPRTQRAGPDMSLDKYVVCRIYNKKPSNKGDNSRQPRSSSINVAAATPPQEDEVINEEDDEAQRHVVDAVDVRPAQWQPAAALPSNEAFNHQIASHNINAGGLGQLGAYGDLSQYGLNVPYQQHSNSGPYYDPAESYLNNILINIDGNNNFIGNNIHGSDEYSLRSTSGYGHEYNANGFLGDGIMSYNYSNAERLRLLNAQQNFHYMQHQQIQPMIPPMDQYHQTSMCYDQVISNSNIDGGSYGFLANVHNSYVPSMGFGVPSSCVFPVSNNTSSCGGLSPISMFLSRTPEELNPGFDQQEAPGDCSLYDDVLVSPPVTDDAKSNHNNEL